MENDDPLTGGLGAGVGGHPGLIQGGGQLKNAARGKAPGPRNGHGVIKTQPRNFIFNGHVASVMWLTFMPDGKTMASSSRDTTIDIWDVSQAAGEKATLFKKIKHHTKDVYCVAYSPDGR
jgi:hypothetical protein